MEWTPANTPSQDEKSSKSVQMVIVQAGLTRALPVVCPSCVLARLRSGSLLIIKYLAAQKVGQASTGPQPDPA